MLKLYTSAVCPFAHRTRLALAAKQIEHERSEIDLADMPAWYKALCPTAKVPMLDHDGKHIWESAIINEYIEEVFPAHPLWPQDAFLKARGRIALDAAGSNLIPAFYKAMKGELPDNAAHMVEVLAALEASMIGDGPFWLGPQMSLTDIGIYPWFERWTVLEHYIGLKRPDNARIQRWVEAMEAHPAVIQERGDREAFIKAYSRYATPVAAK